MDPLETLSNIPMNSSPESQPLKNQYVIPDNHYPIPVRKHFTSHPVFEDPQTSAIPYRAQIDELSDKYFNQLYPKMKLAADLKSTTAFVQLSGQLDSLCRNTYRLNDHMRKLFIALLWDFLIVGPSKDLSFFDTIFPREYKKCLGLFSKLFVAAPSGDYWFANMNNDTKFILELDIQPFLDLILTMNFVENLTDVVFGLNGFENPDIRISTLSTLISIAHLVLPYLKENATQVIMTTLGPSSHLWTSDSLSMGCLIFYLIPTIRYSGRKIQILDPSVWLHLGFSFHASSPYFEPFHLTFIFLVSRFLMHSFSTPEQHLKLKPYLPHLYHIMTNLLNFPNLSSISTPNQTCDTWPTGTDRGVSSIHPDVLKQYGLTLADSTEASNRTSHGSNWVANTLLQLIPNSTHQARHRIGRIYFILTMQYPDYGMKQSDRIFASFDRLVHSSHNGKWSNTVFNFLIGYHFAMVILSSVYGLRNDSKPASEHSSPLEKYGLSNQLFQICAEKCCAPINRFFLHHTNLFRSLDQEGLRLFVRVNPLNVIPTVFHKILWVLRSSSYSSMHSSLIDVCVRLFSKYLLYNPARAPQLFLPRFKGASYGDLQKMNQWPLFFIEIGKTILPHGINFSDPFRTVSNLSYLFRLFSYVATQRAQKVDSNAPFAQWQKNAKELVDYAYQIQLPLLQRFMQQFDTRIGQEKIASSNRVNDPNGLLTVPDNNVTVPFCARGFFFGMSKYDLFFGSPNSRPSPILNNIQNASPELKRLISAFPAAARRFLGGALSGHSQSTPEFAQIFCVFYSFWLISLNKKLRNDFRSRVFDHSVWSSPSMIRLHVYAPLIEAFSFVDPEGTLEYFFSKYNSSNPFDTFADVLYNIQLLGVMIPRTGHHLLPYIDQIKAHLEKTFIFAENQKENNFHHRALILAASGVFQNMVRAIGTTYPLSDAFFSLYKTAPDQWNYWQQPVVGKTTFPIYMPDKKAQGVVNKLVSWWISGCFPKDYIVPVDSFYVENVNTTPRNPEFKKIENSPIVYNNHPIFDSIKVLSLLRCILPLIKFNENPPNLKIRYIANPPEYDIDVEAAKVDRNSLVLPHYDQLFMENDPLEVLKRTSFDIHGFDFPICHRKWIPGTLLTRIFEYVSNTLLFLWNSQDAFPKQKYQYMLNLMLDCSELLIRPHISLNHFSALDHFVFIESPYHFWRNGCWEIFVDDDENHILSSDNTSPKYSSFLNRRSYLVPIVADKLIMNWEALYYFRHITFAQYEFQSLFNAFSQVIDTTNVVAFASASVAFGLFESFGPQNLFTTLYPKLVDRIFKGKSPVTSAALSRVNSASNSMSNSVINTIRSLKSLKSEPVSLNLINVDDEEDDDAENSEISPLESPQSFDTLSNSNINDDDDEDEIAAKRLSSTLSSIPMDQLADIENLPPQIQKQIFDQIPESVKQSILNSLPQSMRAAISIDSNPTTADLSSASASMSGINFAQETKIEKEKIFISSILCLLSTFNAIKQPTLSELVQRLDFLRPPESIFTHQTVLNAYSFSTGTLFDVWTNRVLYKINPVISIPKHLEGNQFALNIQKYEQLLEKRYSKLNKYLEWQLNTTGKALQATFQYSALNLVIIILKMLVLRGNYSVPAWIVHFLSSCLSTDYPYATRSKAIIAITQLLFAFSSRQILPPSSPANRPFLHKHAQTVKYEDSSMDIADRLGPINNSSDPSRTPSQYTWWHLFPKKYFTDFQSQPLVLPPNRPTGQLILNSTVKEILFSACEKMLPHYYSNRYQFIVDQNDNFLGDLTFYLALLNADKERFFSVMHSLHAESINSLLLVKNTDDEIKGEFSPKFSALLELTGALFVYSFSLTKAQDSDYTWFDHFVTSILKLSEPIFFSALGLFESTFSNFAINEPVRLMHYCLDLLKKNINAPPLILSNTIGLLNVCTWSTSWKTYKVISEILEFILNSPEILCHSTTVVRRECGNLIWSLADQSIQSIPNDDDCHIPINTVNDISRKLVNIWFDKCVGSHQLPLVSSENSLSSKDSSRSTNSSSEGSKTTNGSTNGLKAVKDTEINTFLHFISRGPFFHLDNFQFTRLFKWFLLVAVDNKQLSVNRTMALYCFRRYSTTYIRPHRFQTFYSCLLEMLSSATPLNQYVILGSLHYIITRNLGYFTDQQLQDFLDSYILPIFATSFEPLRNIATEFMQELYPVLPESFQKILIRRFIQYCRLVKKAQTWNTPFFIKGETSKDVPKVSSIQKIAKIDKMQVGFFGLCSIVSAYPFSVPSWMPHLVRILADGVHYLGERLKKAKNDTERKHIIASNSLVRKHIQSTRNSFMKSHGEELEYYLGQFPDEVANILKNEEETGGDYFA